MKLNEERLAKSEYERGFDDALDGLLKEAKLIAKKYDEMSMIALKEDGHGASPNGSISAFAWFDFRREVMEYMMPTLIESYRTRAKNYEQDHAEEWVEGEE